MSLGGRPSAIQRRERRGESAAERAWCQAQLREAMLERFSATIEAGCPTRLPQGHHWFCMPTSNADKITVRGPEDLWTPDELEVGRCVHVLATLHLVDPSTREDAKPDVLNLLPALNFGFLVAVAEGRAVGYLTLGDETADGRYDTLVNVWTASDLRRTGVARGLLKRARADHPTIARLQRPITAAGREWIRAAAPDLL